MEEEGGGAGDDRLSCTTLYTTLVEEVGRGGGGREGVHDTDLSGKIIGSCFGNFPYARLPPLAVRSTYTTTSRC